MGIQTCLCWSSSNLGPKGWWLSTLKIKAFNDWGKKPWICLKGSHWYQGQRIRIAGNWWWQWYHVQSPKSFSGTVYWGQVQVSWYFYVALLVSILKTNICVLFGLYNILSHFELIVKNQEIGTSLGGSVVKTLCFQFWGCKVWSLVRSLLLPRYAPLSPTPKTNQEVFHFDNPDFWFLWRIQKLWLHWACIRSWSWSAHAE